MVGIPAVSYLSVGIRSPFEMVTADLASLGDLALLRFFLSLPLVAVGGLGLVSV